MGLRWKNVAPAPSPNVTWFTSALPWLLHGKGLKRVPSQPAPLGAEESSPGWSEAEPGVGVKKGAKPRRFSNFLQIFLFSGEVQENLSSFWDGQSRVVKNEHNTPSACANHLCAASHEPEVFARCRAEPG